MKKTAVFTLLAIFMFNTVGYYIVFKVNQSEAKNEIKSKIKLGSPVQELIAIKLDNCKIESIQWVEKNKEFYYDNELYDIVRTDETSPTETTFYCISDEKEEALFCNLDEYVKTYITNNANKSNSTSKKLSNHVVKIYFFQSSDFYFHIPSLKINFSNPSLNYSSEYSETSSPPPELV